jgi:hypothetical protein
MLQETESPIDRVRVRVTPDGRVSRGDAAAYLGHKPKTLSAWAVRKYGPQVIRVGGRAFYYLADLEAFVRSGIV